MSLSHEEEISNPESKRIWETFQKDMFPYLLSILPDDLFSPGREQELFVALNKALYDKYVEDGVLIPPDIQFRKQLDICSLMPAFVNLKNQEELLKTIFPADQLAAATPPETAAPTPAGSLPTGSDAGKPAAAKSPEAKAAIPLAMSGHIVALDDVTMYRAVLRRRGRKVVVTNGCFDLLHVGHLRYLIEARAFGDFLWVGLNGDASVRELKGPSRPLVPEAERAEMLAALRVADAVTIFPTVRATNFLRMVHPDIYVKGGDYTAESLNPEEAGALRECGTRIEIVPLVPGKSTSKLVEKVAVKP